MILYPSSLNKHLLEKMCLVNQLGNVDVVIARSKQLSKYLSYPAYEFCHFVCMQEISFWSNKYVNSANFLFCNMLDSIKKLEKNHLPIDKAILLASSSLVNYNSGKGIKFMTIHKSKGSENKVVIILDDCLAPRNNKTMSYLRHEKYFIPIIGKCPYDQEEYIRLLYVAITRASQKLVLCGYSVNRSVEKKSWYNIVTSLLGEK